MIYISYIYIIYIYTFWGTCLTLFGHVPDKFGGREKVFPKSFRDVWAILWHHRRCLRRGKKINSKTVFLEKIKVVRNIFLMQNLFSGVDSCIFQFLHIFHIYPPLRAAYVALLKGVPVPCPGPKSEATSASPFEMPRFWYCAIKSKMCKLFCNVWCWSLSATNFLC